MEPHLVFAGLAPPAGPLLFRGPNSELDYHIAGLVRVAQRYLSSWSSCRSHPLALWRLLERRGIASEVRIGVPRRRDPRFKAHDSIEWSRQVLTKRHPWCDCLVYFGGPSSPTLRPFNSRRSYSAGDVVQRTGHVTLEGRQLAVTLRNSTSCAIDGPTSSELSFWIRANANSRAQRPA